MSNLLAIEVDFLRNEAVESALNLREIKSLQRTLSNGQKKKFIKTLELSKKVLAVSNWFASEEGKQATAEAGIYWNNETIGLKVFGWKKSYYYKVLKAGKLDEAIVEDFVNQCNEVEANGEEPNRTLAGLLKFSRSGSESSQAGGDDSEDGGETQKPIEREVEVRTQTVFTMTYKKEDGTNVSVRVEEGNNIVTQNSSQELFEAIAYLSGLILENE